METMKFKKERKKQQKSVLKISSVGIASMI